MTVVREPVAELGAFEHAHEPVVDEHGAHRDIAARQRLRRHDRVGVEPVALGGEPVAGPPVGGDDLVEDEQDPVCP